MPDVDRHRFVNKHVTAIANALRIHRLDMQRTARDIEVLSRGRVKRDSVNAWENCKNKPTPAAIGKYLAYLDVGFEDLALELITHYVRDWFGDLEDAYEAELDYIAVHGVGSLPGKSTESGTETSHQDG